MKKTLYKTLKNFFIFSIILIILLELSSTLLLKFDFFKKKTHTFLITPFLEVLNNKTINLKKKIEIVDDSWTVYTDKNRFRVKDKNFNHHLQSDSQKIIFIGDSVLFGYGVDYNDSVPGIISEINKNFLSINAAVPSYSIVQAIEKYKNEFKNVKNIKYVFYQTHNPSDMYMMFGKEWKKEMNWNNYQNFISQNKFFFKYKKIPFWGEINFFKILRKIYLIYFFELPEFKDNLRDSASDDRFANHINNELNKLYKLLNDDTILILSTITSPLLVKNNTNLNLEDDINKNRKEILKLMNKQLKNFKRKNVIFFDANKILIPYKDETLFIDECCHLSPLGAQIISQKINEILIN